LYIVKKPFRRKRRGKKEASFERQEKNKMRMMSSLLLHKTNARENTRARAKSREGVFLLSHVTFRFVPFCPRGGRKKKARKNNREREEIWIVAVTLIFEEEKYAAETPFLEEEERKQELVVVVVV
jgi:hypothetical protein